MSVAYGPWKDLVQDDKVLVDHSRRPNAHLVLSRLWVGAREDDRLTDAPGAQLGHLRTVASAARNVSPELLSSLQERRRAMARAFAARHGGHAVHLRIEPEWRIVVGHGESSVHETSLSWAPTHGVPIIPGSGLKGAAAARAVAAGDSSAEIARVFGAPRPSDHDRSTDREAEARQGEAIVLDALPVCQPTVVVDVLTPHAGDYYKAINEGTDVSAFPAEYHNPVPVHFLAVQRTTFHTTVLGTRPAVERMAELIAGAAADDGLGGKVAAGYGYCHVEVVE